MIFPLKGKHFCLNNFIVYLQSTSIVPLFTFYGEIIKCELMQKTTSITVDYSSADRFSLRGKNMFYLAKDIELADKKTIINNDIISLKY